MLNQFASIARKYSKDNTVTITKHHKFKQDDYYINFEVDSLEFLPKLERDVTELNDLPYVLVFSAFSDGIYGVNIYNGYLD